MTMTLFEVLAILLLTFLLVGAVRVLVRVSTGRYGTRRAHQQKEPTLSEFLVLTVVFTVVGLAALALMEVVLGVARWRARQRKKHGVPP